ncbi:Gfo/Idh/MocA family protein [Paraburkholderia youngii]|uniref:Gfo/Idh/MocA family protein n=1 Tax=Paraburkholderia youngii TaxID=2782701 RepID=UPI003D217673
MKVSHLRWGVMGAADIARTQVIPAIQTSVNGSVVALASRDPAKARDYARALGIPRVVESYEALLADVGVDAIYIPLPNSMHAEWAMRAAEAGKAVLCEKPLATTAKMAEMISDAFSRHGVALMEGFMYRFHPQHRRVHELIAQGAIGQVREVRAHLSVNLMNPPDPANVRLQPALGGGALLDMGCYAVNIARMIFACEPTHASAIWIVDSHFDVDIATTGILEFPNGCSASVSCSFMAGGQGTYTVIGTEGSIEVPRAILPGMGTRVPQALVVLVDADGNRREEIFPPVNQYCLMIEAFASAVLNKRTMPFTTDDAVANARVLDALASAARTHQRVKVS